MLRKTKDGDEKSGKKTGLLSKRPKLPLTKKAASEKKEESTEDVKPTKTRTLSTPSPPLKRSSKGTSTSKVATRASSDTAKSPTKVAGVKSASEKKLKPGEKLERTSAPVSKVKTSSATSTSPTSAKKTPKAKAKSTESVSPPHSKSTSTPKSETASRRSSSDASAKKESKSTTTTPTKAKVSSLTAKKKALAVKTKHTKSKSLSSSETPRENKISGRIIKTLSGIGQRLKSTTPRDKKTPREKKERKKSAGSSSFRSALESLDEQASEKVIKTSETPTSKPRRSSTSDVSAPTSPATSTKGASKKTKESISATLSPETNIVESAPDVVADVQPIDESPKQEPVELTAEDKGHELTEDLVVQKEQSVPEATGQEEQVTVEETSKDEHPTAETPAKAEEPTEAVHEVIEEPVRDDDEHAATEEYMSLSAGSSYWSIQPNTPVSRAVHEFPAAVSNRSQSLTSKEAASVAGTTSRDLSPELMHQDSENVIQALTEEVPIAEEIKVESPPVAVQSTVEQPRASEESSVGAEVGSNGSKPEESTAIHQSGQQKSPAESSVEAEVGSDDIKMESPSLVAEAELKTAEAVVKKDFEAGDIHERSLEESVQMMGKLVAPEETLVDKTLTSVMKDLPSGVEEQQAMVLESEVKASPKEATAEGGLPMNKDRIQESMEAVTESETSEMKVVPVVIPEANITNEAQDTVPTPEVITSSSQTDQEHKDTLDGSGSDSLVVYHSEEENPAEEKREAKERSVNLEEFGFPEEPVHEEKSETDLEEELSNDESDHESPSFSTSEWSSDAAFVSEAVDIDDPDLPADPAHSDEEVIPKSTKESQPDKQMSKSELYDKGAPGQQQRSLDLQDYVSPDKYTQQLVEDPIDTELQSETVRSVQSRSYIPSPPHEDDPEEESRSKKHGRRGNFVMSALCVLGGIGGIAVTVFLLHKRVG